MVVRPVVIWLGTAMALGSNIAHAGNGSSPADKMCNSGKSAPSGAAVACLERALKAAEADLESAIKRARESLHGGALQGPDLKATEDLFDAAQSHWLNYRNAECAAHERYDSALGAGGPQTRLACLINETVHRQRTINSHFSSE